MNLSEIKERVAEIQALLETVASDNGFSAIQKLESQMGTYPGLCLLALADRGIRHAHFIPWTASHR